MENKHITPEDLMIGDWVLFAGSNYQIRKEDFSANYDFEPIPLTKEVLLKNGFEDFYGGGCIIKKLGDNEMSRFYIWMDGNNSIYLVDYCSVNRYSYIKECKYMHEFQHELKSCGIEKEIVL